MSSSSQLHPSHSQKMPAATSYSLDKTVLYLILKPPLALFLVWVSRSLSFRWVSAPSAETMGSSSTLLLFFMFHQLTVPIISPLVSCIYFATVLLWAALTSLLKYSHSLLIGHSAPSCPVVRSPLSSEFSFWNTVPTCQCPQEVPEACSSLLRSQPACRALCSSDCLPILFLPTLTSIPPLSQPAGLPLSISPWMNPYYCWKVFYCIPPSLIMSICPLSFSVSSPWNPFWFLTSTNDIYLFLLECNCWAMLCSFLLEVSCKNECRILMHICEI